MHVIDLIKQNRSYRRFHENIQIPLETLRSWVELARLSPSAANRQPLRYVLSNTPEKNSVVFPCLAWAGYLKDWPGPVEGERPAAYITVLGDSDISSSIDCDHGIAAQSILLGAVGAGYGGCIIGSINKDRLRGVLHIPERYDILLVLAFGKPKETVIIETITGEDSIKYRRDSDNRHHVPKRRLEDIILSFE